MSYLGQQLGQGQAERFIYTATGGETSVTSDDAGRAIAYTVGQVDVYLNGAKLINGSDFTATTGTSITGLAALTASDVVEVFALSIFQASDTVSASTGGTFNGNITINADLTVDTNTLFVDASANRVGIGTSSPSYKLDANGIVRAYSSSFGNADLIAESTAASGTGYSRMILKTPDREWRFINDASTSGSPFLIYDATAAATRLTLDSSGNVGIGTSSPSTLVEASKSQNTVTDIKVTNANTGTAAQARFTLGNSGSNFVALGFLGGSFTTSGVYRQDGAYVYSNGAGGLTLVTGAAQPIYFAINNSEKMRLDSSGRLLVGKTASNYGTEGVEIRSNEVLITNDGGTTLSLNRLTSDGTILGFAKDGTTVGSIGTLSGFPYMYGGTGFLLSSTALRPADSDGTNSDADTDLGSSSSRFKDLYLSGGVYLGGTGAANLLDDYEEGTWTPALLGSTGNPTITYTTQSGRYTKIGRIVYCEFDIEMSAKSGGSGDAYIAGLPFTKSSANPQYAGDMAMLRGGRSTALDSTLRQYVFSGTVLGNDTAFELSYTNTSGVATAYTNSDVSTGRIVGSFQYIAA